MTTPTTTEHEAIPGRAPDSGPGEGERGAPPARPEHDRGLFATAWALLRAPIRSGRRSYFRLGWLLIVLFLVQVVTGTLLSLYYEPAPKLASESVRYIMRDVSYGWLVRGLHHWVSNGMVLLVLVQVGVVLGTRAYRRAAASLWTIGVLLLVLVIAFATTGWLLPWDDAAYWATRKAMEAVQSLPVLGTTVADIVRGGRDVAGPTLSRVFAAHAIVLPWPFSFLVVWVLWTLARRRARGGER